MNPIEVAQAFVERINATDVVGLAALMTEDHRFIDSLGNVVQGRETMRAGWVGYFAMVPEYHLAADQWLCDGPVVVMFGTASGDYCPDGAAESMGDWSTPAAFRALIRGNLVAEWQVYADNEPIRQLMRRPS
jgi:ketosteroid isomerase-like protein